MTSHDAELSRNMDRITQLQDGIDNLVTIMYSTLSFLSRKADFKQVNPDIPISQIIPCPDGSQPPRESFVQNCEELVRDFLRKAKQIEYLISILPPHNDPAQPISNLASQPVQSTSPPQQVTEKLDSKTTPPFGIKADPAQIETGDQQSSSKNTGDDADSGESKDLDNEGDLDEFDRLQADLNEAQNEYDQALLDAESLHSEIKMALRQILDHRVKLMSSSL